jgi:flavin-dependent dehydrogenase
VDGSPARYLVAADGLHSPLRRRLGLDAPVRAPRRFGQRCHLATAPWTSYVEVHWASGGEAYVTPLGADCVGVAVLSSRRRPLAELLGGFPTLAPHLDDVVPGVVRGAGPLRQRSRSRVRGRVLLVGDAAGYVDALTGEGIAIGLAQARAAVAALVADAPATYETAWRRITRRHDLLTHGLLAATRLPAVRSRIVPAAATLPRVFEAAVGQLARPA